MNMIRPVSDLRNNFADISKTVQEGFSGALRVNIPPPPLYCARKAA